MASTVMYRLGVFMVIITSAISLLMLPWVSIPVSVGGISPSGKASIDVGLLRCFSNACKAAKDISSHIPDIGVMPGTTSGGTLSKALKRASMWTVPFVIAAILFAGTSLYGDYVQSSAKLYSRAAQVGRTSLKMAWVSCVLYLVAPVAYASCALKGMGSGHFASGIWLAFVSSILCTFLVYIGSASTYRETSASDDFDPVGAYSQTAHASVDETTKLVSPASDGDELGYSAT